MVETFLQKFVLNYMYIFMMVKQLCRKKIFHCTLSKMFVHLAYCWLQLVYTYWGWQRFSAENHYPFYRLKCIILNSTSILPIFNAQNIIYAITDSLLKHQSADCTVYIVSYKNNANNHKIFTGYLIIKDIQCLYKPLDSAFICFLSLIVLFISCLYVVIFWKYLIKCHEVCSYYVVILWTFVCIMLCKVSEDYYCWR